MCQECVLEAESNHRALTCVPVLPCARHGRPVLLSEYQTAWELYQRMNQHRQFSISEQHRENRVICQVFLNYAVVDMLLRLYVPADQQQDVFEQLHVIHDVVYPREEPA